MNRCFLILLLLLLSLATLAQGRPRAVFVIADGIAADMLERHAAPAMKRIAASGAYLRAFVGGEKGSYTQSPTISAVGYNSLLTGTWANKHNVWDNHIDSPNYSYPSVFRLVQQAHPEKALAIFSSWTDNRTKLAGAGMRQTGHLAFRYISDGHELDTLRFPPDKARNFMHAIDEQVVTDATRVISEQGPDLSWIYLEYTDDIGHRWGDSEQLNRAIALLDSQVARIDAAIQQRVQHYNEDWLLLLTTDHGRDSATGKHHGGQSDRERNTWIISNKPLDNAYAKSHKPGIVDIYPTIARHMRTAMPEAVARELDGVPLTGPVSVAAPAATLHGDSIVVRWKALEPSGTVNILFSATDHVRTGGADTYQLVATVPVQQQQFVFRAGVATGGYFKIVVEGKHNTVNRWVAPAGVLSPRK